jgi:hypothetical protein
MLIYFSFLLLKKFESTILTLVFLIIFINHIQNCIITVKISCNAPIMSIIDAVSPNKLYKN